MNAKSRRLGRLFRHADGKAILSPIDHGLWYGPMSGIEQPQEVARKLIPGSDGLLVAPGFAGSVMGILPADRALVLRLGATTALSPVQDFEVVFAGIETALRLDADAVVHTLYLGASQDDRAIRDLGRLIERAGRFNLPVLAEFLPARDGWTWEQVALWARFGYELGADMIKTVYTGAAETFRRVVSGCPLPILIAGGPRGGTVADLLRAVAGAVDAGAAGTAIGRQVWQREDPEGLLDLISRLIHRQIGLEEALEAAGQSE